MNEGLRSFCAVWLSFTYMKKRCYKLCNFKKMEINKNYNSHTLLFKFFLWNENMMNTWKKNLIWFLLMCTFQHYGQSCHLMIQRTWRISAPQGQGQKPTLASQFLRAQSTKKMWFTIRRTFFCSSQKTSKALFRPGFAIYPEFGCQPTQDPWRMPLTSDH